MKSVVLSVALAGAALLVPGAQAQVVTEEMTAENAMHCSAFSGFTGGMVMEEDPVFAADLMKAAYTFGTFAYDLYEGPEEEMDVAAENKIDWIDDQLDGFGADEEATISFMETHLAACTKLREANLEEYSEVEAIVARDYAAQLGAMAGGQGLIENN
ncbi:hypothetical protein [Qipengyuania sp. JC766]|uniref:hypothetical protein n=1 Tax=Qipengyuania sp. JC766 TaxID=3232139 RepID=UPI0034597A12